jgi:hypothetical protein
MIAGIGSERPLEHVLIEIGNAIADFWAPQEAVALVRMIIAESIRFPELGQSFFTSGRNPVRRALVGYLSPFNETQETVAKATLEWMNS